MSDKWEVPDVKDMLLMLGQGGGAGREWSDRPEASGGFHHAHGEYIVDPDWMEVLGLSPEELVKKK